MYETENIKISYADVILVVTTLKTAAQETEKTSKNVVNTPYSRKNAFKKHKT